MHPLDNPVWHALHGPQCHVAELDDLAARYLPEVSRFGAFPEPPGPPHWAAMERLIGPGGVVIVTGYTGSPPEGWGVEYDGIGVQMTGEGVSTTPSKGPDGRPEVDVVALGGADAAEMLELVELARPGPFAPRTWLLGGYVGVRRDGTLVAMAGQRFRPPGCTEISAVATHPDHRREGLGELLVQAVVTGVVARGDVPMLHVAADNAGAVRLYESLGFTHRGHVRFIAARAPGDPTGRR